MKYINVVEYSGRHDRIRHTLDEAVNTGEALKLLRKWVEKYPGHDIYIATKPCRRRAE